MSSTAARAWMFPLEGEALLISAMTLTRPSRRRAAPKSRGGGALVASSMARRGESCSLSRATCALFARTIRSRTSTNLPLPGCLPPVSGRRVIQRAEGAHPLHHAARRPRVDRLRGPLHALLEVRRLSRDHEGRGGVQQHHVAPRSALAVQDAPGDLDVARDVPAGEILETGALEPGVLRRHLVY